MKFLAVLTVLFLVSAQAFAEELGDNEELNYWSDWSDGDQNKVSERCFSSPDG